MNFQPRPFRPAKPVCLALLLAFAVAALPLRSLAAGADQSAFRARRQRLARLAKEGIVVVETVPRNQIHLTERFIEHSENHDFFYLTGWETLADVRAEGRLVPTGVEDATLVLLPQSAQYPEIVFVPPNDVERARAQTGIPTVLSLEKLTDIFSEALTDFSLKRDTERLRKPVSTEMARVLGLTPKKVFYFNYPRFLNLAEEPPAPLDLVQRIRRFSPNAEVRDATPLLTRLRVRHDPAELESIRKAVEVGSKGLLAAMRACRPGAYDYQVATAAESAFKNEGAERLAYPPEIYVAPFTRKVPPLSPAELGRSSGLASGIHQMEPGDLVMLDVGTEHRHYATDLSRTVPVSGKFNEEQRKLYDAVLAAHHAALAAIRPGATIRKVHQAAVQALAERGLAEYFTFGTSHFIGMQSHDPGNYDEPLEPGMLLVIEPGVSMRQRNILIHVEDMVLVTDQGNEVLSRSIPIEIADVENFLAGR